MGFPTLMNQLFRTIYHMRVLRNREVQVKMQRCWWAWVGLANFFKFRKNKGARHQSCQQLSIVTPNWDGEVTKRKWAGNFLIHFRIWAKNLQMHIALVVVVTIDDLLCKRAVASNNLFCLFDHLSVIKITPNNWVRWRWIVSNNNTVIMQNAPFGRMASFVTEDNFCH